MKRETRPWDSPCQYYGKYNILERVLVDNIIPRNVITTPRLIIIFHGMIFSTCTLSRMYICFTIPNIIALFSYHGLGVSEGNVMRNFYEWMKQYISQKGCVCKKLECSNWSCQPV